MRGSLSVVVPATAALALICVGVLGAPKGGGPHGATIIVTTTDDSGPGSLRQALADAHDGDTIQFDSALNGQSISLTTAELLIGVNISIIGPGSNLLSVRGNLSHFRVFHIGAGHTVAISGLRIEEGQTIYGAGILNSGTLTVTDCVISSNRADVGGSETHALLASGPYLTGGGIYNEGTLTLLNTTVTNNQNGLGGIGGGGISNNGATLTISQSAINGNTGWNAAGGILNINGGLLTISDSTINNNRALPLGHSSGNGGGIDNSGTVIIQNSTVSGNTVSGDGTGGQGGGISNYGSLDVINSTINSNTAIYGGGIYFYGGGHVTNSTISSNTVQFNGGGIWGGAIVSNSTISGNSASQGGGIYATRGPVELINTIFKAGSSGANIFDNGSGVTSHGYNISSDNGGGLLNGPGDQIDTDPMLGPLQGNGGPTQTHALLPGSPAIDAGDPSFTPPPFTDQRGYPRVYNARIDIGSFELQPTPTATPTSTATSTVPPTPTPSATSTPTVTPTPSFTPTPTPPLTPTPTLSPAPTPTGTPAQALNLSTRLRVLTGTNVGIGGFIITGTEPKQVLVRGIGPSLSASGVPNPLANPALRLSPNGGYPVTSNDNWRDTQEAAIIATGLAPTNDLESAILVTLMPGQYTVVLLDINNGTGVALVEVYDLDQAANSKLANVSTRGFVGTGGDIMIAGFILGGNEGSPDVVVRGIGPSLPGVPNALANPWIDLRNSSGTLVHTNNDWIDDPVQAALISEAGLAPTNNLESAIYETLAPGQYTALLSGANNGTGVGLVEIYNLR